MIKVMNYEDFSSKPLLQETMEISFLQLLQT
jgi:hypothetical protein